MVIYGTRPEAVKVAPLIRALGESPQFTPVAAVTAQHRSMLDQVNDVFGIRPEFDLDIHQPGQTLTGITTRALGGVQALLAEQRPDAVVVQGDTTTVFASALAGFYERIPVVHLEAGLRTSDPYSPYPEEINRRMVTRLAALHLAPTATSRANLLSEHVDPATVVVTGNTVIDALQWAVSRPLDYGEPRLAGLDATDAPVLLVTAHRRESWGAPLRAVGRALSRIAVAHPELLIVFPVHRNPTVREAVLPAIRHLPNVIVTEPLPYGGFARLMSRAALILTDSGGVQGGTKPGQAGARDAGHHGEAGSGQGRHGPAGRYQREPHCRHRRLAADRPHGLRGHGQCRQPLRRRRGLGTRGRRPQPLLRPRARGRRIPERGRL